MGAYVGDVTALQFLRLHAGGQAQELQLLLAGVCSDRSHPFYAWYVARNHPPPPAVVVMC